MARGEPRVVGLISPRPEAIGRAVEDLRALGYRVLVERASMPDEAAEAAARLSARGAELIILPGSWRGPWERLSEVIGVPVVRGPWSPGLLVDIASRWGLGRLLPRVEAEKVLGPDMARLAVETLMHLKSQPPRGAALHVGEIAVPSRPPPLVVVSELYVRSCELEAVLGEASWRILEGADIVALGWDGSVDIECYWRILRGVLDRLPAPVAADPGRPRLAVEAARRGAPLALSLTPSSLDRVPGDLRRKSAFVVVPEGVGVGAAEELALAARRAENLGFESLILDPLVFPPVTPGLLPRLSEASRLAAREARYPLMMGINNVYELLDSDTHGSIALLAALAAEAGISVILVGEESTKAQGATWEAYTAAAMASLSLYWGKPPKDLGYDLLIVKEKGGLPLS